jgi:HAE1 family hydrophobic/amphiphilic exporter-1
MPNSRCGAVTSSTLTTVAVFLPIGLVSGQTGELFRPFAMTVTIALLASLFVALTVVPVLASWFMRRRNAPVAGREEGAGGEEGADAAEHGGQWKSGA